MKKLVLLLSLILTVNFLNAQVNVTSQSGTFTVTSASSCAPVSVSFNSTYPGVTSYAWTYSDGGSDVIANPAHVFTVAGTKSVNVTYYDAFGFPMFNDYAYFDVQGDIGQLFTTTSNACIGDRVDFNVNYGNYDPSLYQFTFDYGDGNSDVLNQANAQHIYTSLGTFNVTCTVTGPCGTHVESTTIIIGSNVPMTSGYLYAHPMIVCPGDQVNFYYSGASSAFIQYGDGNFSNTDGYYSYQNPGYYTVTGTLYNGCGNSIASTLVIEVSNNIGFNPQQPLDVYNSSPICPGQEVRFDASSQYEHVEWSFSDGSSSNAHYYSKYFYGTTNDTVYATITNGCGFDTTVMTVVEIETSIPIEDINLWMPASSCTGSAVPYSGDGMSDPDYSQTYTWDFGDGSPIEESYGSSHTYAADGVYNVTLTVSNTCGNDSTQTHQITIGPGIPPDPNFSQLFVGPEDGACVGDTVLIVLFPYVPGDYLFDFGDGNTTTTYQILDLYGKDYMYTKHAYGSTGTYTISVTYTNTCGLSWTKTYDYSVGSSVQSSAEILYDDKKPICFGEPINFLGLGGSTYVWDFGDGTGTFTTYATFQPVPHTYANPGVYTVNCKVTNGCGFSEILTRTVVVPDNRIHITTNTIDAQCGQSTGTAIAIITGGILPYDVTWSSGDTTILVDSLQAGLYVVNVTDKNGCYNFEIATVSDAQAPAVLVSTLQNVSCYGGNDGVIDINVIGNSGPYTYQWSNGANTEDVSNLVAGPYEVYVTDANGCVSVTSIDVEQPEHVLVSANTTLASCGLNNGAIFVDAVGTTGPYTYVWSTGHTGPTRINLGLGVYTVNVIDQSGCIITQSIPLSEDNGIGGPAIVVNSISPLDCNGPGSTIDISVYQTTAAPTFLWSNGATTEDITVSSVGTYTVTVSSGSCSSIKIIEVDHAAPEIQNICLVSVDSMYSVNKVVWEKAVSTDIASYNIYRESSQNGLYFQVGNVPYDSLSVYVDYVANPMITSWRYKITAVDFCGEESEQSPLHKTIHLNQNLGLGGTINLIWDHYEGFDYSTYEIIRYTTSSGWNTIGSVSSANTSFTDGTPPSDPSLFYVIEASPAVGCFSTRAQNNNSTRSNRTNNPLAPPNGLNEVIGAIEGIAVYPNPNDGNFTLQADFIREENASLVIFNLEGQVVYSLELGNYVGRYSKTIDLSSVAAGVYFVRLNSESSSFVKKLVINK